jgi:hypothetical protein
LKTTATTTITATATNRKPTSLCLTKYIKNFQQANKRTALEYEYRLSKFEKYVVAYQQQYQQQQNQDRKIKTIITSLDQVIEELKRGSNSGTIGLNFCLHLHHPFNMWLSKMVTIL